MSNSFFTIKNQFLNSNISFFNNLNFININATINELKKIDNRRNLDSSKIFTELYNLIEGK